jgi:ATP-binding cassette subfamily B (MDR/TAP) protein 1
MIIIAHRLSTIRDVDNIVVMAKGQVVEQGSHDELVKLGGAYSRLVKTQDLGKGNGDANDSDTEDEDKSSKVEDAIDLDNVVTQGSTSGVHVGQDAKAKETNMGLLVGMYKMFREQPRLWKHLVSIAFFSIIGGKFKLIFCPRKGRACAIYTDCCR